MDKACFQHDMAYGGFKDLARSLRDEAFNISKDTIYDGNQGRLAYAFFNKNTAGGGIKSMLQNWQLAEELHKRIIRKFQKRKVYSSFKDNIWGADLADMQSTRKFDKGYRFLLCVTDIFSKYACVVPLKNKKGATITNAFQNILKDLNKKPNKVWVDKISEFYNNL